MTFSVTSAVSQVNEIIYKSKWTTPPCKNAKAPPPSLNGTSNVVQKVMQILIKNTA
jgi:hypothetical protein